jgi:hypothetical protein
MRDKSLQLFLQLMTQIIKISQAQRHSTPRCFSIQDLVANLGPLGLAPPHNGPGIDCASGHCNPKVSWLAMAFLINTIRNNKILLGV